MRWGKRLLTPEQKISFINQNETDQKNGLLLNKVVLKLGRYVSIYKKSHKQLLVFAIIQTLSINTPAQNRNQCSFLFQEYNSLTCSQVLIQILRDIFKINYSFVSS